MSAYRLFRGEIVEELPDGKVVDPFLMALVRHHSATPDDEAELLSFLRTNGFRLRHLEILLKRFGNRIPLLASRLDVTTWEGDRMLRCTNLATTKGNLHWSQAMLRCDHHPIPESIAPSMRHRRLGEVVEHPYMPPDLVIGTFEQVGARWTVQFEALGRKAHRKAARTHLQPGAEA